MGPGGTPINAWMSGWHHVHGRGSESAPKGRNEDQPPMGLIRGHVVSPDGTAGPRQWQAPKEDFDHLEKSTPRHKAPLSQM